MIRLTNRNSMLQGVLPDAHLTTKLQLRCMSGDKGLDQEGDQGKPNSGTYVCAFVFL